MSLIEFERRIKKLAYVDSNDMEVITLRQLKACFEDHWMLGPQIKDKNSLVFRIFTDEFFQMKSKKYDNHDLYYDEDCDGSFDDLSVL